MCPDSDGDDTPASGAGNDDDADVEIVEKDWICFRSLDWIARA